MKEVEAKAKKPWYKRVWAITLFILLGIGFIASFAEDKGTDQSTSTLPTTPTKTNEEIQKIDAIDLYSQYTQNEVRADELYKGKQLRVTGIVGKIDKTILNKIALSLMTDNYVNGVVAYLPESEKDKVINLNVGNEVTLDCVCNGKMVFVLLDKCKIK